MSDGFRSDLGFITTNNLKNIHYGIVIMIFQKDYLKSYRISLRHDFEYSFFNDISRSSFQSYIQLLTILNTDILWNYEYNFIKSHFEFQLKTLLIIGLELSHSLLISLIFQFSTSLEKILLTDKQFQN